MWWLTLYLLLSRDADQPCAYNWAASLTSARSRPRPRRVATPARSRWAATVPRWMPNWAPSAPSRWRPPRSALSAEQPRLAEGDAAPPADRYCLVAGSLRWNERRVVPGQQGNQAGREGLKAVPLGPPRGPGRCSTVRSRGPDKDLRTGTVWRHDGRSRAVAPTVAPKVVGVIPSP